jgi:hypothetical protein
MNITGENTNSENHALLSRKTWSPVVIEGGLSEDTNHSDLGEKLPPPQESLDMLREKGLIWEARINKEETCLIIDIEAILSFVKKTKLKELTTDSKTDFVMSALYGGKAITLEDFKNGVRIPKDIIYLPATSADAFDIAKIHDAEFYLSPIALGGNPATLARIQEYAEEPYDIREAWTAAVIYNKDLGCGRRENGKLLMRSKLDRKEGPITTDKMDEYYAGFFCA